MLGAEKIFCLLWLTDKDIQSISLLPSHFFVMDNCNVLIRSRMACQEIMYTTPNLEVSYYRTGKMNSKATGPFISVNS